MYEKYDNFKDNYEKWIRIIEKKLNNKIFFSYSEINQRFKEFNAPFNAYCRDDYIDYNYVVDRILTMSLPYVDVKKENNNNNALNNKLNNNNNNPNTYINNDNNKNIIINKDIKDTYNNDNNEDSKIKHINNNYINNNYIHNNYIHNNKININIDDCGIFNEKIIRPEPLIDIGRNIKNNTKININDKNDSSNNSLNKLYLNNNNNNFLKMNSKNNGMMNNPYPQPVTANNILHSLGNMNRYNISPGNNKLILSPNLISSLPNINNKNLIDYHTNFIDANKQNIINNKRPLVEDCGPKKTNSNLMMNAMQTPSQSSFLFQQKPSLMEMSLFNRNGSSHIFDDEGDALKQILAASSDKFFKSSLSFDSPKYPYGAFSNNVNNNSTNNNYINNNESNNNMEQKSNENKRNYNEMAFRPLNNIGNKIVLNNILMPNKIIYNDYENNNNTNYEKEKEKEK